MDKLPEFFDWPSYIANFFFLIFNGVTNCKLLNKQKRNNTNTNKLDLSEWKKFLSFSAFERTKDKENYHHYEHNSATLGNAKD
jgi:hypothetical protein